MAKILQLVIKNTSALDFTTPLIWKLSQKKENQVCILFCNLNKKQILRESHSLEKILAGTNVQVLDFSNFTNPFLKKILSLCFSQSISDQMHFINVKSGKNIFYIVLNLIKFILTKFYIYMNKFLIANFVNHHNILSEFSPDIVLFDNRAIVDFPYKNIFYEYFEANGIPVILIPHAPHFISKEDGYADYHPDRKDFFPLNIDVWVPFTLAEPEILHSSKKNQFFKSHYPMFDQAWIKHQLDIFPKTSSKKNKINCLYIGRKFLFEGIQKPSNYDPFTLTYDEIKWHLDNISKSFKNLNIDFKLILKPHPSSNFLELKKLINQTNIEDFEISHSSFFEIISNIDICISPFSTSLLIPIAFRIPTITLDTELQRYVHSKWEILQSMYSNFNFFQDESTQLESLILKAHNSNSSNFIDQDYDLLRKYYSSDALSICENRINYLLKKK